jgi:hypothetical protein
MARQGELDAARDHVHQGADLLAGVADRLSQGLLECDRAEVQWRCGDRELARATLLRVARRVDELATGERSELVTRLDAVRRLCGGDDPL